MTEAEALRLARQVLSPRTAPLCATPVQGDGGVVWHVSELVIGAAACVRIDDATGAVIESGRYNAR